MKRIAAVATVLCAMGLGLRAPVAAGAESPIGAHAMLQLSNPPSFMEAMFKEAAAMHASTLRMDIAPSMVFTGQSGSPDFSGLDDVMSLAQKYHVRVVGDLFTIPAWIANCPSPTGADQAIRCGTDDLPDYASMISQIVHHADPVIRDWEIWNEPDTGFFFAGTPQQYARMLQAAHDAIKQIDSQANVLLGGISGVAGTSWLAQVFATPGVDAAHDFDIANVHERAWLGSLASDLGAWKRFLAGYGFSGPLWVTEHGYPSDPAYQYDPSYTGGPTAQADYLTASVPTLLDAGASKVFVTERDNLGGQYASEGLLGGDVLDPPVADPTVVEKPSYTVLSALAACYQAMDRDCVGSAPVASPSSVAIRPTAPGSSRASTVTVSNPGSEPVQIGSVGVVAESGGGISVGSDECSGQIVEPNQSCSVAVVFAPTTGGVATATLQVPSDQGTIAVQASAVSPSVSSLTAPRLAAPRFHPIPGDGVGHVQWLVLLLSNPLSVPVHVSSSSLSGPDSQRFATPSSPCAGVTLAPGGTCQVSVRFDAKGAGTATAVLTLAGDGLPLQIPLSATAFALPRIKWIGLAGGARCLTVASRRPVRVLTDQPSTVSWQIEPRSPRACGAGGAGRSSARGHAVTGRQEQTVGGHLGYVATFAVPRTLRAGAYRLTVIATSAHGSGAAVAASLGLS